MRSRWNEKNVVGKQQQQQNNNDNKYGRNDKGNYSSNMGWDKKNLLSTLGSSVENVGMISLGRNGRSYFVNTRVQLA